MVTDGERETDEDNMGVLLGPFHSPDIYVSMSGAGETKGRSQRRSLCGGTRGD